MNRWMILVLIPIIAVVSWLLWFRGGRSSQMPEEVNAGKGVTAPNEVNAYMEELARKAAEEATRTYSVSLDFQPSSVEQVENILSSLHQKYQSKALIDEQVAAQANLWGAYVGEVIRRVRPGSWQRDSIHAGRDTMPVVHDEENEAYPCAWVYQRIVNGPEDNVSNKFQLTYMRESLLELKLGGGGDE